MLQVRVPPEVASAKKYLSSGIVALPYLVSATDIYMDYIFLSQAIGQLGSVQGVDNKGNVIVYMKGHMWTFNPLCIKLAEKEEKQEVTGEGMALQKSLLVVFKSTATLHSMYLQGLLLMYVLLVPVHRVCMHCMYALYVRVHVSCQTQQFWERKRQYWN